MTFRIIYKTRYKMGILFSVVVPVVVVGTLRAI